MYLFYHPLGPASLDMFKPVHFEARTVGKWAVGIRLECFLVSDRINFCVKLQNAYFDSVRSQDYFAYRI